MLISITIDVKAALTNVSGGLERCYLGRYGACGPLQSVRPHSNSGARGDAVARRKKTVVDVYTIKKLKG